MKIQEQMSQQYKRYHKTRLIIAIAAILLFAGVTVGILNILGIIKGPWSSILFFVFAALSVVIAFLQKVPSTSFEEHNQPVPPTINEQGSDTDKLHVQVEGIDLGVNESTGALVVYAKKTMLGESADLRRNLSSPLAHSTSNIVRRNVNNGVICTAVFPRLEPSDYIVSDGSGNYSTRITVLPGLVTEIDWRTTRLRRRISKKEAQLPD